MQAGGHRFDPVHLHHYITQAPLRWLRQLARDTGRGDPLGSRDAYGENVGETVWIMVVQLLWTLRAGLALLIEEGGRRALNAGWHSDSLNEVWKIRGSGENQRQDV